MRDDDGFSSFHARIRPSPAQLRRAKEAHRVLRDALEADHEFSTALTPSFLHGSYARSTQIRPPPGKPYDVDIALVLDLEDLQLPFDAVDSDDMIAWLRHELARVAPTGWTVRQQKRCVKLRVNRQLHLDVVPLVTEDGDNHPQMPDREDGEWRDSDPWKFNAWFTDQNQQCGGRLTRLAKFVRWWSRSKSARGRGPTGLVLDLLCAKHCPVGADGDGEALALTLSGILAEVSGRRGWPVVEDPIVGDNVAARLDDAHLPKWCTHLKRAVTASKQAERARPHTYIRYWRKVLGPEFGA